MRTRRTYNFGDKRATPMETGGMPTDDDSYTRIAERKPRMMEENVAGEGAAPEP